jgi:positive regulator of sigma E activity
MMEHEYGTVIKNEAGRIVIQIEETDQCQTCGSKRRCVSMGSGNVRQLELSSMSPMKPGDSVTIEYEPKSRIIAAFLIFIVPLLFLVTGYAIGANHYHSEGIAILSALMALLVSFFIVGAVSRLLERRKSFTPVITNARSNDPATEMAPVDQSG